MASHYVFRDIKHMLKDKDVYADMVHDLCSKYSRRYADDNKLQEIVSKDVPRYLNSKKKAERKAIKQKIDNLIADRKMRAPGFGGLPGY